MATDEEYLDNLLKSLTGGDEPETESEDENNDTGDMEENEDLMSAKAGEKAESEEPAEMEEPEEPVKAEEQVESQEQPKGNEQAQTADSPDFPTDSEEAEGGSFLDSLDMELDNVEDWKNDIDEFFEDKESEGETEIPDTINLDGMDSNPADIPAMVPQSVEGEDGGIDDPELLQMFENLENADSDLVEINSLLNKANMNEDVDDDMLALLESAGENQNFDDSEEAFDIFAEGEMDNLPGSNMGARANAGSENESDDKKKKKKKKPGFLAKILAILTKEADEGDEKDKAEKPDKEEEISDANAKLLKELNGGGGGKKAAAKEKKKPAKKDKKKKAKPAAKPKPKKPKKQKEKKPVVEEKPVKILNTKGLISIIALCASIIAGVLILSSFLPQYASKQEARMAFNNGDYETTYELFYKKKLSKKETELYNKAKTVRRIERKLQSYENNMAMDRELEAVDALFLGIKCYEGLREADTYDVRQEVDAVYQQICSILESNYGISQEEAVSITRLDNVRYTKKIKALVGELAEPEETDNKSQKSEDNAPSTDDVLPEEEDLEEPEASVVQDVLPEEEDIIE